MSTHTGTSEDGSRLIPGPHQAGQCVSFIEQGSEIMLVLSRKTEERIRITIPPSGAATVIEIMVTEIRCEKGHPRKVKLGITAPKACKIMRTEIDQENQP